MNILSTATNVSVNIAWSINVVNTKQIYHKYTCICFGGKITHISKYIQINVYKGITPLRLSILDVQLHVNMLPKA